MTRFMPQCHGSCQEFPGVRAVTVSVSRPERTTRPGRASSNVSPATHGTPLTTTCSMPTAPPYTRPAPAGRSNAHRHRTRADGRRIEHHDVGGEPLGETATIAQAIQRGGRAGEVVNGLFDRHQGMLAHRLGDQRGGEAEAVDHVEVGARVGGTDDGPRVAPHLDPALPRRVVLAAVLVGEARYADRRPPPRRPSCPTPTCRARSRRRR